MIPYIRANANCCILLACLVLPALAHSAEPSSAQQQQLTRTPTFSAEKWAQLKVGMSLQEVFDLLGAPAMQLMRNAGEGKIETTWTYLFDGGFEKAVRFGVPIAPETQVLQSAFAGNPQAYATADLSGLGLRLGRLFDWSGRTGGPTAVQPAPDACVAPDDIRRSLREATLGITPQLLAEGWYELDKRLCTTVQWTGDKRPLPAPVATFMEGWMERTKLAPEARKLWSQEIRVREGEREYWLLIQDALLPPLEEEIGRGGTVTLQFKRFGAPPNGPVVMQVQEFLAGGLLPSESALRALTTPASEAARPADSAAGAGIPRQAEATAANRMLRDLIKNHPDEELRAELDRWIREGAVYLTEQLEGRPAEMVVGLVPVGADHKPVVMMNPEWLTGTAGRDATTDRRYKELVVYHEYIHLKDHFNGTHPLMLMSIDPIRAQAERVERAQSIWIAEYRAVRAEWEYAKRMGLQELMSDILRATVEFGGEERGVLEAFHRRLTSNQSRVTSTPDLFRATWDDMYAAELRRLLR